MSYVVNALFQGPLAAEEALHELALADLPRSEYQVSVREPVLTEDLRASQSDGRKGFLIGLAIGAAGGALFGVLLCGPLGLLHLPIPSALLFGMFLGVICGALGGGLYGLGLADHKLDQLADRFAPGQTLVTADIQSLPSRRVIEEIFRHHGAIAATG
jgi:uncharacterized membrane protein